MFSATPEKDDDIRKFEEIGTHPVAIGLGIAEALTFHQGLGAERIRPVRRHEPFRQALERPETRIPRDHDLVVVGEPVAEGPRVDHHGHRGGQEGGPRRTLQPGRERQGHSPIPYRFSLR